MTAADDANLDELKRRARRRLVGAIVLALVVAVVVPMLLESDPKPLGEDVAVKIPPVDEGKFVNRLSDKSKAEAPKAPAKESRPDSKVEAARAEMSKAAAEAVPPPAAANAEYPVDTGADTPPAARPEPVKAEPPTSAAAKSEPPKEAPKAASAETPKAAPATAGAPGAAPASNAAASAAASGTAGIPAASPNGLFAVQVYAFSDAYGANSLVGKLKRAGYPAYSESTSSTKGNLWRVRIGPYASREVAATARDKLKGEGYNGIVTTK